MPLSKGAGVNELIGLVAQSNRLNYTLYRPILDISKDELKEYLYKHDIKYFVDESNMNTKFKRNYFRKEFSNKFITEYKEGVKRSFDYIQEDIKSLNLLESTLVHENLSIAKFFKADMNVILRYIDKKLKQFGIIISSASRDEIKKQKSIIISNRICIEVKDNIVWISPLIITIMEKSFKDECRILRVPSNIRPYLFNIDKKEFDCLSIKIKKFIT
jgi:tRNA(Ile)-lysidine synthase